MFWFTFNLSADFSSIGVGGTSAVFILDFNTGFFRLDFFALDFSTLTPNYGIKYSNQNIVIKYINQSA